MAGRGEAASPRFVAPDVGFRASFVAALREFQAEGGHLALPVDLLADPRQFARYVVALLSGAERPGGLDLTVAAMKGEPPPDGYVPQTTLWWVEGDAFVGRLAMRHRLTPHLQEEGGNVGYDVRPSARRRGHATAMLAAALPRLAALGVDPALIDCDADNVASRRVIEKNGGRLERAARGALYYLVVTRPG